MHEESRKVGTTLPDSFGGNRESTAQTHTGTMLDMF